MRLWLEGPSCSAIVTRNPAIARSRPGPTRHHGAAALEFFADMKAFATKRGVSDQEWSDLLQAHTKGKKAQILAYPVGMAFALDVLLLAARPSTPITLAEVGVDATKTEQLRTIAERSARIGGKLTYASTPGKGTLVKVEVVL